MLTRLYRLIEGVFCFLAISVFTGAYVGVASRLSGTTVDVGGSDPYSTAANEIILVSLCVLCAIHWRRFCLVISRGLAVNLFVLLALVSALWSLDPEITLRRVLTLLITACLGYFLLARFPVERIIRILAVPLVVSAVASAAVAVGLPRIGVMTGGDLAGDWNGVFGHKNALGAAMMLGCLCCGWLTAHERTGRAFTIAGFVICFGVAVMSRSRTSVMAILFMPLIGYSLRALQLPGLLRVWAIYLLAVGGTVLAVLGYNYFDGLTLLLDKDPSLSGRAPLWNLLIGIAAERPLLGHGYGAFWLEGTANVDYVWKTSGWTAPEAHNSYLDAVLELGAAGLVVSCAILGSVVWRAAGAIRRRSLPWASFAAIYAITLAGTGLFETDLLRPGGFDAVILPLLYAGLGLAGSGVRAGPVQVPHPQQMRAPRSPLVNVGR